MKIIAIKSWQPDTPGSPPDWRTQLGQIIVQVKTDDGFDGYGVGGGGPAGVHIVETVLRDAVVGKEFSHPSELHAAMCRFTSFFGRKGVVVMAVSGVDLALWDAYAKTLNQSIFSLLNSNSEPPKKLETYTTVFTAKDAISAAQAGFRAVKLHVERFGRPPEVDRLVDHVAEVREIMGPERGLMIDAFGTWNVTSTLEVAERIAGYQVDWIEEPVAPNDTAAYQELNQACPVPIAGGEHEYLREGFEFLIDHEMHSILQPDINWCGGLTTLLQIYEIAEAAGLRVCPHRGSEPYSIPAIAAVDPQPLAESPRTWFNALEGWPSIIDGRVSVPPGIGFGVSLRGDEGQTTRKET